MTRAHPSAFVLHIRIHGGGIGRRTREPCFRTGRRHAADSSLARSLEAHHRAALQPRSFVSLRPRSTRATETCGANISRVRKALPVSRSARRDSIDGE